MSGPETIATNPLRLDVGVADHEHVWPSPPPTPGGIPRSALPSKNEAPALPTPTDLNLSLPSLPSPPASPSSPTPSSRMQTPAAPVPHTEHATPQTTTVPTPNAALPEGCTYGSLPKGEEGAEERVIWVEFGPGSPDNPLFFTTRRKVAITACALFYTWWTAFTTPAYAIQASSMCAELDCTPLEAQAGIAVYAFAAGICPLVLAPLSEELGRTPTYLAAVFIFALFHMVNAVAQNMTTVLVARFLLGAAGSIGSSVVGGTIADMFIPSRRGLPMALFGFAVFFASGAGGTTMAFVDVRLSWRWVWWIHFIILATFFPITVFAIRETRSTVILRRRAAALRKERGMADGARYLARSEVSKVSFMTAMQTSLTRPLLFLAREPLIMFFSLWISLAWGVYYTQVSGLPYIFRKLHHFNTEKVGLVYLTMCIGAILAMLGDHVQERIYRRKEAVKGVDARLYAPMVAGVLFFIGCFIVGFTAVPDVHWIAPTIGLTVVLTAIMIIYITTFTYLSECYGSYASSAIAAQSLSRNVVGGSFAFITTTMFERMTSRWALVMMGAIAALLALVPFVAYWYGPTIRAHSKYSRELMEEERLALENERDLRAALGMDATNVHSAREGARCDHLFQRPASKRSRQVDE